MWAKQKGFTIVELLIVIVVIAVLAAITIVAYNGFQLRAENSKTQQGVQVYVKAVLGYSSMNGNYPVDAGYPCLGAQATCALVSGSGTCPSNPDGGTGQSTAFDALLQTVINSIPQLSTQTTTCGGNTYRGAYYRGTTGKDAYIVYYIKGDQTCGVSGLTVTSRVQQENMTRCHIAFSTLP